MSKKLMLLDGHSVLNRAFYALPVLSNSTGEYTNAVLGFLNIFFKLLDEERPDCVIAAFDLSVPTFRHKLYAEYKGTRKPMPEELRPQVGLIKQLLSAMAVPVATLAGYEADDVLGSLARRGERDGYTVAVVSGDRDLLQLATDKTKVRIPRAKGGKTEVEDYFAADVLAKLGVTPAGFIDVKALMGDTSDNIPGVPGIGEKTAHKIIGEFGSLEAAIESVEKVTPKKASENLAANIELARLSRELAVIDCDAPVDTAFAPFSYEGMFNAAAHGEFKRLELKSHYHRFDHPVASRHPSGTTPSASRPPLQGGELGSLPPLHEIRLLAYVLNEELDMPEPPKPEPKQMSLFDNTEDDVGNAAHGVPSDGIPSERDIYLLERYAELKQKLDNSGQGKLYYEIELPLAEVLADMERIGIGVDADALREMGSRLQKRIDVLTAEIHELAGEEFNINSPKQMGEVLFDRLGIKAGKTRSTAADVLEKLAGEHEICAKILEYRKHAKLKSTYADGLLHKIQRTGRIHTTFNQMGAATGRISSGEPNLQNIPVRTQLGRQFRKAFVAAEGYTFVDADYSQIELRILAALADDETMIEAFKNGQDIHTSTAASVFHVEHERVTSEQRSFAKAVNFGIVYGIGAFSLSEDLGISVKEAQNYIDRYFHQYPKIKEYCDRAKADATRLGYAETIFGRRRIMHELKSPNHNTRAFGERAAMNMPIQGSAADIIKLAMVRVWNKLRERGMKSRLVLQVHDELLIEAIESEVAEVAALLKEEMEGVVNLSVPLTVDINVGKTWYDTK